MFFFIVLMVDCDHEFTREKTIFCTITCVVTMILRRADTFISTRTHVTHVRPSRRKPASRGASLRPRRKQQIFHYFYVQMAPLMATRANISGRIERNFVRVCVSLGRPFDDAADWQVQLRVTVLIDVR